MFEIAGLVFLMFGVAAIGRRLGGSWIAPAPFFALLWAGYAAVDAFFVEDASILPPALLFVLLASIAMVGGAALGSSFAQSATSAPERWHAPPGSADFPLLHAATAALLCAGLVEVSWLFARSGLSLAGLVSVAWVAQISAHNREAYGFGDLQQSMPERVLFALLYTGPFFGGLLTRVGRAVTDKVLGVGTLILVFLVGTLYGSRMGALYGSSCWIAAYIAASFYQADLGSGRAMRRLFLWASAAAVIAILGLSVLAMIIRYGGVSGARSLKFMVADAFGFLPAFAEWYHDRGLLTSHFSYGYQTFTRLFEIAGVYFPQHEVVDVGFTTSNIFTALRGLIEDFGWVGALSFLFGLGVVGGVSHRRVGERRRGYLPALSLVYAFNFTSLSFSLFRYTTVTFGGLAFCSYFAFLYWSQAQARPKLQNP